MMLKRLVILNSEIYTKADIELDNRNSFQIVGPNNVGKSNTFSKIYRYRINSKLITNKMLRKSLIIADNRENERVEFSKTDQEQIKRLSKHKDQINKIKSIEKEFSEFKELVCQYKANERILSEIVYAFNKLYLLVIENLALATNCSFYVFAKKE